MRHTLHCSKSTFFATVLLTGGIALLLSGVLAEAQPSVTPSAAGTSAKYIGSTPLPGEVALYMKQLGKRLVKKGLESAAFSGTYSDSSGTFPANVTWQNPGLLKMTIRSASIPVLTFDGASAAGASPSGGNPSISATQKDIVTTLTDDYPDNFFLSMANGAIYRMLGNRYRTDGGTRPGYTGPYYSLYQKVTPASKGGAAVVKLFMFDEATGLLDRVTYLNGLGAAAARVEVQYSNWQVTTSGEHFPGKIVRLSKAGTEFTLTLQSATFGPAVAASNFGAN